MPELKQYITRFIKTRKISIAQLTNRLGYKSQTSITRIMHGNANNDSAKKFAQSLMDNFELSNDEKNELDEEVQIITLGRDGFLAQREMWVFLNGSKHLDDSHDEVVIESVDNGARQLLAERYASSRDIHMTLLNCQCVPVFSQLKALLRRRDARINHYVLSDGNTARTIHTVNVLMPIF